MGTPVHPDCPLPSESERDHYGDPNCICHALESAECVNIWGDEDGDRWFAEGHWPLDVMREAVIRFEREVGGFGLTAENFTEARVSHYWIREDPEDEERFDVSPEPSEGFRPATTIVNVSEGELLPFKPATPAATGD